MTLTVEFVNADLSWPRSLVVLLTEGPALSAAGTAVDLAVGGALGRALSTARAKGAKGEVVEILSPAGIGATRVLAVGLGKADQIGARDAEAAGAAIAARLLTSGETEVAVLIDAIDGCPLPVADLAARVGLGAQLRAYRFLKYRTALKDDEKSSLATVKIMVDEREAAAAALGALTPVLEGVFLARDLASEPANILYPASLADRARALSDLGVTVTVLGEAAMADLGMGALLGVGQGSTRESQLIVLDWRGHPDPAEPPLALVGKGVCFDSGGISLKPADGMWDMKWDMGGAAAVLGAMRAIAGRKAAANVVAVIAAVENMPDGNAQRPGDVVTSASGLTIEVLNTDAEGRLILADAVWYAQTQFKPKAMVDLATLTGAIIVALGADFAGLFANDEDLAARLLAAAKAEGEGLWRMPLGEGFDKKLKSPIADIQNISGSREGGASVGAAFIHRFVKDVPWAHIDIAGTTWTKEDKGPVPKGAVGYGVRLLDRLVADAYEA